VGSRRLVALMAGHVTHRVTGAHAFWRCRVVLACGAVAHIDGT